MSCMPSSTGYLGGMHMQHSGGVVDSSPLYIGISDFEIFSRGQLQIKLFVWNQTLAAQENRSASQGDRLSFATVPSRATVRLRPCKEYAI